MQIDRNNYESYFLDFLEGRLPEQEIDHLLTFLKKNPDLEDSLQSIDKYLIESNNTITLNKNFLFKSLDNFHSVNEDNFDEFSVAYYEKDLSDAASRDLSEYLKSNPGKLKDFEKYGEVILKPSLNVKYPFKSKLKKLSLWPIRKLIYFSSAAAAILLVIMYLIPSFRQINPTNQQTIAITEEKNNSRTGNINKYLKVIKGEETSGSRKGNQINPENLMVKQPRFFNRSTIDSIHKEMINIKLINSIKINDLKLQFSFEKIAFTPVKVKRDSKNSNRSYFSIKEFALRKLHRNMETNPSYNGVGNDLTLWDIAKLGVSGINKLTGTDIKLDRKIDDEGKIVAMNIESGKLGFSRSLSK